MSLLEPVLALAFAGVSAWLLWRALARREITGHYGSVYARSDSPIRFWLTVGLNLMALVVFGGAGLILAYQALVPALTPQRASAFYPTRALEQNVSGVVILHCTVTPGFGVKDCSVVSETPAGMGFGASALQISALEVLSKRDRARAAPGKDINLPIRFKIPPHTR